MTQRYNEPVDYFDDLRNQEQRDRRSASVILACVIISAILSILALMVGAALAQEREFTLRMNSADLQVLDAAINKAPMPREMTQPFVTKMQAQIVEQSKPAEVKGPTTTVPGHSTEPKPSPAVNLPATPETGAAVGAPPGVGTQTPPK